MSVELLLDDSAWARLSAPVLSDARAGEIADALEEGRIGVCLPFLLEAGHSASSGSDHDESMRELMALPMLRIDAHVERRRWTPSAGLPGPDTIACRRRTFSSRRWQPGTAWVCCTTTATTTPLRPRPACAFRASGRRRAARSEGFARGAAHVVLTKGAGLARRVVPRRGIRLLKPL